MVIRMRRTAEDLVPRERIPQAFYGDQTEMMGDPTETMATETPVGHHDCLSAGIVPVSEN